MSRTLRRWMLGFSVAGALCAPPAMADVHISIGALFDLPLPFPVGVIAVPTPVYAPAYVPAPVYEPPCHGASYYPAPAYPAWSRHPGKGWGHRKHWKHWDD